MDRILAEKTREGRRVRYAGQDALDVQAHLPQHTRDLAVREEEHEGSNEEDEEPLDFSTLNVLSWFGKLAYFIEAAKELM